MCYNTRQERYAFQCFKNVTKPVTTYPTAVTKNETNYETYKNQSYLEKSKNDQKSVKFIVNLKSFVSTHDGVKEVANMCGKMFENVTNFVVCKVINGFEISKNDKNQTLLGVTVTVTLAKSTNVDAVFQVIFLSIFLRDF